MVAHLQGWKDPESRALKRVILERIGEHGKITFAEFMDLVLYHPKHGYYKRARRKVGGEGDFITSASGHPIFGHMLARQIAQMWEIMDCDHDFAIVEMGAGEGHLCLDILDYMKERAPRLYETVRYVIFEESPYLRKREGELLQRYAREGKVTWGKQRDFESGKVHTVGCFISNELVDAFPVHRVAQSESGLKEIFVTSEGDALTEVADHPSSPEVGAYFERRGVTLVEGQKAEVNLAARDWIEKVSRALARGFVITIDYGYRTEDLYAPFRMEGTLMCYFRHRAIEDPYVRLGYQDLTCHVNFSDLVEWGKTCGLETTGFAEQYKFLLGLGILDEFAKLESKGLSELELMKERLAIKKYILPEGVGTTFKVLVQHKGVASPKLKGLESPSYDSPL
jgi:SAM-dependent MidA family methyltransferase